MKQKTIIALVLGALFLSAGQAHALAPVDENGVPLVNARGDISVNVRAELGDHATFGERLRVQKDQVRATIESKNRELRERVEEGRAQIKSRIEEKRESFEEKHAEVRAKVEAHVVLKMKQRYEAAVLRLETLASRIEARMKVLSDQGKDVSAATTAVTNARASIATAKTEASAFVSLGASAELSEYRTHAEAVKKALNDAKKYLTDAVRLLKGLSLSAEVSANTSVEAETN